MTGPTIGAASLRRTAVRPTVRVDLTPRAVRQVRSLLAARSGEPYGLRISVDEAQASQAQASEMAAKETAYRLSLAPRPHPGDLVLPRNGFEVFVLAG